MKFEVPCTYKDMMERMFECINRALKLKDVTLTLFENYIKVDGGIDGKYNEHMSDGELV